MILCQLLNLQASHFIIHQIVSEHEVLTLTLESRCKRCRCPSCHKYSYRIHSKYQRSIQDLPCFAHKALLQLIAHKFYCHNPHCPRKIFTERFSDVIIPYKRMTKRLCEFLSSLALKLSSRSVERLCTLLHTQVSDTTLARMLQKQPEKEIKVPKVLGVDDWAMKKRNRYGTILVDLEQHKIIDLLQDRESTTLQKWLEEHPGVQIVSRDRYTNYSNAITKALPRAIQVVDRWHLLKNLCDGLQKLVERNHQHLKYARQKEIQRLQKASSTQRRKNKTASKASVTRNFSKRLWQLKQVKRLHRKGASIRGIVRQLHISRITVKKYLELHEPPQRKSFLRVNIALFDTYIRKRIEEEPHIQILQLYKELKQMGYNGGRTVAYDHLHDYVGRTPHYTTPKLPDMFYLPSRISFLLVKKKEQLNIQEQKLLRYLCRKCQEIKTAAQLATEFKQMMERKKGGILKRWIRKVVASGIAELIRFANGIMSDFEAVKNALTMPWSNGQVEGQINKLKTIKRQMYGRASFELLRKRLLLDSF